MSKSEDFPWLTRPESQQLIFEWRQSSQQAAELYDDGAKLWNKADLLDIEEQLAGPELPKYTVRSIKGNDVEISNPMFGARKPIWKPHVRFQEYWMLVKTPPKGPPETCHCSYLVDWENQSARNFRGTIEDPSSMFEETNSSWTKSESCTLLRSHIGRLLGTRTVKKIICFGLGDMCRGPPEWFVRQLGSSEWESTVRDSMMQHSTAMALADICRDNGMNEVQLLTQDPDYTDQTKEILKRHGFTVVGHFGAGGFAEIDEDSVVFSPFVEAPVKQIIADVARPVLIITTGVSAFNDHEKPLADADSPRTKKMWGEYERLEFPTLPEDKYLTARLSGLYLYTRKAADPIVDP